MLMQVLRVYPAYTLDTILDMPFCHFKHLYDMVDAIDKLNTLNILNAIAAQYDKSIIQNLNSVHELQFQSHKVFEQVVTTEAKQRAEAFANIVGT
jgi:hypothetical protein